MGGGGRRKSNNWGYRLCSATIGRYCLYRPPEIGKQLTKDQEAAVIESVKAAGEIKSPIEGEVIAINETLADTPETINKDPMGDGWCFILRIKDDREIANLLDEASYKALIQD